MEQHTLVRRFWSAALLGLSACGGATPGTVAPATLDWPESAAVLDASSGAALDAGALRNRLAAADFVLLGEVHDNPAHHELRGRLITALADRRPAVVFEQIPETGAPIIIACPWWFECRVTDTIARGDHTVYVAEVVNAGVREGAEGNTPLLLRSTGMNYGG